MNKYQKKAYRKGKRDGSRKAYAAGKRHGQSSNKSQGYKFGVDDVIGFATVGPLYQLGKWFVS